MTIVKGVAVVVASCALIGAAGPGSWLDAKTPANWNVAGAALPSRPGALDAELAPGGRCASGARPANSPEDQALGARGGSLVGPYERYGSTVVVMAAAGADGMCRPLGYQAFVFVNGAFAGTLSPKAMSARIDGSIASLNVYLYDATDLSADFARYNAQDAMCCPHATTNVIYHVAPKAPSRVVPDSLSTRANNN